jgi:hypothetical protein
MSFHVTGSCGRKWQKLVCWRETSCEADRESGLLEIRPCHHALIRRDRLDPGGAGSLEPVPCSLEPVACSL